MLAFEELQVPAHFDAEVFATLRRALREGVIGPGRAELALAELARFTATRVALSGLLAEAYAARNRFSAYDVFYAVLARRLSATLVTTDTHLARACAGYVAARLVS